MAAPSSERDDSRVVQAAIWLRAAEWRLLGSFAPNAAPCDASLSRRDGTSSDGRVVVGLAWNGCSFAHAFRWEESTGMVDLGSSVAGRASLAGVSGDGKVVVGYQERQRPGSPGRAMGGRPTGIVPGPVGFVGTAQRREHRRHDHRRPDLQPGSARPTSELSKRLGMDAGTARGACRPALRVRRPVHRRRQRDERRWPGDWRRTERRRIEDSDAVIWIDRAPHYLKDYLRANGVPNAFESWVNTGSSPAFRRMAASSSEKARRPPGFRGYIVILGDRP